MSTKTKHKHIAIIGRIPDEENVSAVYSDVTSAKAEKLFEKEIISDYIEGSGDLDREEKKYLRDQGVYIDFVITSDSPLHIDSYL